MVPENIISSISIPVPEKRTKRYNPVPEFSAVNDTLLADTYPVSPEVRASRTIMRLLISRSTNLERVIQGKQSKVFSTLTRVINRFKMRMWGIPENQGSHKQDESN